MIKLKLLILSLLFAHLSIVAQNKYGNTWIVGQNAYFGIFDNGLSRPSVGQFHDTINPGYWVNFIEGHSSISDSLNGNIQFYGNEAVLYGAKFGKMMNGDYLCDSVLYNRNGGASGSIGTQASICLPKSGNTYYYITIAASDSTVLNIWYNPTSKKAPADQLYYHVIDMDSNNGNGKVVRKRVPMLLGTEMAKVGLQACRHANGKDWWLLKQGLDSNIVYRFLFTADSVYGPFTQLVDNTKWGLIDRTGQSNFSADGSKYCYVQSYPNQKCMIADFDRCTGIISNAQILLPPIDSTGVTNQGPNFIMDSLLTGIAFSPNNRFLYIAREFNIYQYDTQEPNINNRWTRIWRGPDTSYFAFDLFGALQNAPDGRIYVGKFGGVMKFLSVIDSPNNKGLAASFCPKCFRIDTVAPNQYGGGLSDPPNMPNYNLGASNLPCWPLNNTDYSLLIDDLVVYPNPAYSTLFIQSKSVYKRELYNSIGQLVCTTFQNKIDVSNYRRGLYFIKVGRQVKKINLE
jgi:hypothetical protein